LITFAKIEQLASAFPGAGASTSYGTPAIKVGKKLLLRMHQKEDAIVMMLGTVEEQHELIAEDPMAFYITDHYADYAAVLIRPTIEIDRLRVLFELAWRRVASKKQLAAYQSGQ